MFLKYNRNREGNNLIWNKEKFEENDAKLIGFRESFKIISINSAAIEGV